VPLVRAVSAVPLRCSLTDPFVIANARLDHVDNVAVRVELDDGSVGWGEIGTLPPITAESASDAVAVVEQAAGWLPGLRPDDPDLPERLAQAAPRFAASRAGIEVACWDAQARSDGVPLWRRFGTAPHPVVTDITLPIGTAQRAGELAAHWRALGFGVLKVKVGRDMGLDLDRLAAIAQAHPQAQLVLDANEGWTVAQALEAVARSQALGLTVALLEQPVPRGDLEGLARLAATSGVLVAADEACRTVAEAERIGKERLASAINVKVAKSGVRGALDILATARRHGLATMIGAMVESRIGTGFSAHLVAGLGGFAVIDLDTPWLMTSDPVLGGTPLQGPLWRVDAVASGHGCQGVTRS
jgi:L-alanine-DL-glutamate epimerase-like enolase superfamily enzyme